MATASWEKACSHLRSLTELARDNTEILKVIYYLEEELRQFGAKISEEHVSLRSTNAALQSEVAALQSKVDDLESQIKELKLKNAEHSDKESQIALGQVAWLFERSLAMFVLPEDVKYGKIDAESFMYEWLEENKESDEGQEGKRLYNHALSLQKANKKLHKLKRAKTQLKNIRSSPAHPNKVDLDDARSDIEIYLPSRKDECLHMIDTVEKIHSLMKLGKLAGQFLKGVYKFVFNEEPKEENKYPRSIQDIQKSLNKKEKPYERWMHLKGEIDWNNDHHEALGKMQNLERKERPKMCLFQDVILDTAKKYVVDFVPEDKCDDVINLIKKLNSLQLGQLATDFQDNFIDYVVPDENLKNVREVEDWLEREKDTQQRQKAIRRRTEIAKRNDQFETRITWTKNHQNALEKMMELKGEYDIDTEINMDTAKLYYIDFLQKSLWKAGSYILVMYERLQKVELHD